MVRNITPPKAYHVLSGESGWEVRDGGSGHPLGWFENREDAISFARDTVAAEGHAQLVVHHRDGSIASQWPRDEDIALGGMEVFDAGELAVDVTEDDGHERALSGFDHAPGEDAATMDGEIE